MSSSESTPARFIPSAPTSPGSMTRREFDRLSPVDRARAMREGWRVIDGPAENKPPTITRAQFDRMPQAGRDLYLSRGGAVAD